MRKSKFFKSAVIIATFALMLTACTNSSNQTVNPQGNDQVSEASTVEITDVHGTVTVPVNPKNVVALDNRTFETLSDWGIELAAVPKPVMPADSPYVKDESVQDIGSHGEPNLEIIAAVDPELVIVGQRFARFYDDIKKLVPNAAVIDLNFDVSTEADAPGENLVNGLKDSTIALGQIFDKNKEAEQLVADFDQAIAEAKSAYNGTDTVMSVVVSGGNIGFSAPHSGRVWGPMYEIFGWTPALKIDGASSDHQGDDVSVEAIAQSNPDWIFVLDRDAAVSSMTDAVPAQDVIDKSPALQKTTAVSKGQIVYAPKDTYTNESIQTYLELFEELAKALTK
ncbi:siderophore ABC transporter substrate-binding protein [Desulfitobacterium hafniense]|uniref:Fe/B12 periplasmic-binding domain-containing protein n=5 Tax=root TaxID=1 RepID=Q24WN9_DESHY|nr:siderophore ABC transporter substrate-binding protein [Desulfitobacterium hafniense]ACL20939.1 periplasmic binding protein [Desulfitobacterium hafniense DCB-2]EHL06879.1 periplasmic binding protein [Desulfitobacterium hafniense DP7]KTE91213.1 iron ABC transporter substrate-binding protein [Desulfitobacterium hafniense]MEA5023874.1 siderophore ABC transporter substrate-binding protein [Desulfitobacterium hafniense]CDX01826.1 Iron compound ABC transporter, iron compound-binding protein [Desul